MHKSNATELVSLARGIVGLVRRLAGRSHDWRGHGMTMDAGPTCALETLELRVLMSATPGAQPLYRINGATATVMPASTVAPVGINPATMRKAYGIDLVTFGSIVGDGAGQTIAIVDAYNAPNIVRDLHAFDHVFHEQLGLPDPDLNPVSVLTVISQTGSTTKLPPTDPAGPGFSWAVESSLDVQWTHVVAPKAKIVLVLANSNSFADLSIAINTARRYPGVSAVSMSFGGGEFYDQVLLDPYFTTPLNHNGVTFLAASGDWGFGAMYPSTSPTVVAVGGTYLTTWADGSYSSESGWYGSGGGMSFIYPNSPPYQDNVIPFPGMRSVPDVAMVADPRSGVPVMDSWDFGAAKPWQQVGGTSLAAPLWAGIIALANQGRAIAGLSTLDGFSQTLPALYGLPTTDFHDIISGSNGMAAAPGWDFITGLGTPYVNLVVPGLVAVTQALPPTVASLTVSPTSVTTGSPVTLTATNVLSTAGTITRVAFYRESNGTTGLQPTADTFLANGTQNGTSWSIITSTNALAAGDYTYYAVAFDSANLQSTPVSATLTVTAVGPANDNFASATVIAGTSATIAGTNAGATKQPGEPNHAMSAGGRSVWYAWTAPATGLVTIKTMGSNFDTLLGVYTGNSVSRLTRIASNDDASAITTTSSVTFKALAGTTYRIAVDGVKAAFGNIVLNLEQTVPPANDNFASAAVLSGTLVTWTGTNRGATKQAGEPVIERNAGGTSIWFNWTAASTGFVALNTTGSSFDTLLGVFTGNSVSTLTKIATNDDDVPNPTLASALTFNAVAGTTYRIVVDGYSAATGDVTLNLSPTVGSAKRSGTVTKKTQAALALAATNQLAALNVRSGAFGTPVGTYALNFLPGLANTAKRDSEVG